MFRQISNKKQNAFVLVELMIIIAIIGILIAIAVPSWLRARQNSHAKVCVENLSKISGAVACWAIEEKKSTGDAAPTVAQLATNLYLHKEVFCPSGNTPYVVTTVGTDVTCPNSLPDHVQP